MNLLDKTGILEDSKIDNKLLEVLPVDNNKEIHNKKNIKKKKNDFNKNNFYKINQDLQKNWLEFLSLLQF